MAVTIVFDTVGSGRIFITRDPGEDAKCFAEYTITDATGKFVLKTTSREITLTAQQITQINAFTVSVLNQVKAAEGL